MAPSVESWGQFRPEKALCWSVRTADVLIEVACVSSKIVVVIFENIVAVLLDLPGRPDFPEKILFMRILQSERNGVILQATNFQKNSFIQYHCRLLWPELVKACKLSLVLSCYLFRTGFFLYSEGNRGFFSCCSIEVSRGICLDACPRPQV